MPIFRKIRLSKSNGGSANLQSSNPPKVEKPAVRDHPAHRSSTPRVSGREAFATPSIRSALSGTSSLNDKDTTYTSPGISSDRMKKDHPFSQEELVKIWREFVEKIDAPQLKSALSTKEPVMSENWKVEYQLDNELQLQRLTNDLKPKLLGWLRRHLKNDLIEIDFSVSPHQDQSSSVPYTQSEKWQVLVEKYPALARFKSKFGLDFE